MNLKSLPAMERPRERLVRYGSDALSAVELLAILLGSGTQERSVLALAADLLGHFGSLEALADATLEEVKQIKGIGLAKAVQIKAAFGILSKLQEKEPGILIDSAEKAYAAIQAELSIQKIETLLILLRDVRKRCIYRSIVAKGTLTELLMHPREIFNEAIRHRAHSLIIAHNHPSGDPTPSSKDLEMTRLLFSGSKLIGIELSDHLIIGRGCYISFFEKGLLRNGQIY